MKLRDPKMIRLGGWGAGGATLLAVAAGGYVALTFFQSGDVVNGGIVAGMSAACGLFGALLAYCLFVFAGMQPAAVAEAAPATVEPEAALEIASLDETPGDEDAAIAISTANSPLPPPELSDDAIPVFAASQSSATGADDSVADLLVVPPPLDAVDDSDSISVERSVTAEEFDSQMDLPVRIETPELNVEDMDDVPPAVQSRTNPVVSALTQTDEVDALDFADKTATPEPMATEPLDARKPSPVDAFPDIFKSVAPKGAPVVSESSTPPPSPAVPKPSPAQKLAPAAVASRPQPPRAEPADEESLPVVDDLSDIAITLGPVTPTGALPTEIPDFFLKMPTGRSMPTPPRPVMPVAPVAPRQVAPAPKPVHQAQAVVRIIDSTTVAEAGDDLVTMTAIPDDWPS